LSTLAKHRDGLQDRDARAQERRELLIEEQEIVGLETRLSALAAAPCQSRHADSLRRRDGKDAKALAFKSRASFRRADGFNGARDDFARRRSQTTNELGHDVKVAKTKLSAAAD
jgi:hypothetical protein